MESGRVKVPQAIHRYLFKIKRDSVSKETLTTLVENVGLSLSNLVKKKVVLFGDTYNVQLDVRHPQLPERIGEAHFELLDSTGNVIRSWYK